MEPNLKNYRDHNARNLDAAILSNRHHGKALATEFSSHAIPSTLGSIRRLIEVTQYGWRGLHTLP